MYYSTVLETQRMKMVMVIRGCFCPKRPTQTFEINNKNVSWFCQIALGRSFHHEIPQKES